MWTIVAKHEWRALKADSVALWSSVMFLLAAGCALANGAFLTVTRATGLQKVLYEEEQGRQRHIRLSLERERQVAQENYPDPEEPEYPGIRNAFWASWNVPPFTLLPPGPLAALNVGPGDLHPVGYSFSNVRYTTHSTANPLTLLIGYFDLSFVMLYLYPLLIIAMTYNLMAVEKDNGTLALLLSQPVALRSVMMGKVAIRGLIGFGSLGMVFALAAMVSGPWESLERFAIWMLSIVAYGLFWFALSLWINSLGKGSATNALALIVCWGAVVIVIPALANFTASIVYPVPSRVELIDSQRVLDDQTRPWLLLLATDPRVIAERKQVVKEFFARHPRHGSYDDYTSDRGKAMIVAAARREYLEQQEEAFEDRRRRAEENQENVVRAFRYLSPAMLLRADVDDLSGSSKARHKDFLKQAEDFQRVRRDYGRPKQFLYTIYNTQDYQGIPRFHYREEPLSTVVERVRMPLLSLLAWPILAGALALIVFRRYRILD